LRDLLPGGALKRRIPAFIVAFCGQPDKTGEMIINFSDNQKKKDELDIRRRFPVR